ncbi:MAG: MarR family transcriptional regulator [Verrucomicrobiae bacterium]|nr:MarR family transcriptional regulator [Verrucomicrobiae bacterium]
MQLTATAPDQNSLPAEDGDASAGLEHAVIQRFVEITRTLGQPRSLAEIYGLLFISPRPLAMDELMERLQISKGSASQGLRYLRELGAVRPVEVPGDRRTHYEAVAELRKIAGKFLRDQIGPRLAGGDAQLQRLQVMTDSVPPADRAHMRQRVEMLRSWERNVRRVLPVVERLLNG